MPVESIGSRNLVNLLFKLLHHRLLLVQFLHEVQCFLDVVVTGVRLRVLGQQHRDQPGLPLQLGLDGSGHLGR